MKFTLTIICLVVTHLLNGQVIDEKLLEGFKIRSVGPAGMSGRITAIDVVNREPKHIYAGSASGGVWESKDGGISWEPIFDDQVSLSIGAIKINQQNPSEIWVGTGEGNPRNSHNSGKGLFRTLDGGRTWKQVGLEKSHTIHRILIDQHNPSIVYVGAAGSAWGPNPERGVYKTTDSGATWTRILYSNDRSGVGDMVMDPNNPRKIIAALYDYGRTPWDFTSGGEGSGLHITYDGGVTWKKLTSEEGLPKGNLGRIGLAIAPSQPDIVYALIEAKENGLYKSVDGGSTWSLVSTKNIGNRPFYYHELYADPKNENRIWNLYSYVSKSDDGGRTFNTILDYGKGVHPDHHAFWIHPEDTDYMIDGNDGGLNISRDGGRNWYFCENIPVGQFYHINVDNEYPYNIYGGMQDNGSWVGPAFVLKAGGIRNNDWRELYFGDGFDVLPKLTDTRYGWAMSQGGNLAYYDRETGLNTYVKPVHPDGVKLRFNWNAALSEIPKETCGIYYGSQFVHRSTDCGKTWTVISPDLTTNDTVKQKQHLSGGLTIDATGAENHTTILCIAPSHIDPNVIWVGTDDGNVQLTRDGGKNWQNLIGKMPGAPMGAWVPQIEVSPHNAGEAFVVINDYRRMNDKPYVYHSTDFGATWKQIANASQVTSFVQCIEQDPVAANLLFLGADDGLYVSMDKGTSWTRWSSKTFPRVSTTDLKVHPTDHSLAIGTFGRSIWVLDNLLPLRDLANNRSKVDQVFSLYGAQPGVQTSMRSVDGVRFTADAEYKGDNRPSIGVRFLAYVKPAEKKADTTAVKKDVPKSNKKEKQAEVKSTETAATMPLDTTKKKEEVKDKDLLRLTVLNMHGDTIRKTSQKLQEGWNNISWDMRGVGVRFPSRNEPAKDADEPGGEYVIPGQYKIVGKYNGKKDSIMVNVTTDPRITISAEDMAAKSAVVKQYYAEVDLAQKSFKVLQDARKDMKMVESMMTNLPDSTQTKIKDKHKELYKQVGELELKFMEAEEVKGITSSVNLGTYLGSTSAYLFSSAGSPGPNTLEILDQTKDEVNKVVVSVNAFLENHWKPYQECVRALQWPVFKTIEPVVRK